MNSYCVLMTSCIDPSRGWVKVHRADPLTRFQDYLAGLKFWMELPDPRIKGVVYIDNSGWPLDELRSRAAASARRPCEFISIDANEYPPGTHYGYAELGMIDHALGASNLLQQTSHFIKATGRLQFPSVSKLLDRVPEGAKFAVDSRNSTALRKIPQVFVTSQLLVFSVNFYKTHLVGIREAMGGDQTHLEKILFEKLLPYRDKPHGMMRWPVIVSAVVNAAHWDKRYDSPRQKAIDAARAVCRVVFPNWWI